MEFAGPVEEAVGHNPVGIDGRWVGIDGDILPLFNASLGVVGDCAGSGGFGHAVVPGSPVENILIERSVPGKAPPVRAVAGLQSPCRRRRDRNPDLPVCLDSQRHGQELDLGNSRLFFLDQYGSVRDDRARVGSDL